jgi:hypothetical protein
MYGGVVWLEISDTVSFLSRSKLSNFPIEKNSKLSPWDLSCYSMRQAVVDVVNGGLELYKKISLKKGSATDPIPATSRLT